jgi:hypothetical protein
MSLFSRDGEECFTHAFSSRNFPLDIIIRELIELARLGQYPEEHFIEQKLYDDFKESAGSLFNGTVVGPGGFVKLRVKE